MADKLTCRYKVSGTIVGYCNEDKCAHWEATECKCTDRVMTANIKKIANAMRKSK